MVPTVKRTNFKGQSIPSMFQVCWVIFACFFGIVTATDTLRANQSLRDSEMLVSSGQYFKLGFFSPVNSSYRYVGILYGTIPEMTVIWVANRDKPLKDLNGSLQISGDGNLVILDGKKEIVWSSSVSSSVVSSSARLLDTGNLVVQDSLNGGILWESFEHASDSWIPKLKFFTDLSTNEKNTLTSWTSPSDPAPGRFTSTIEPLPIPQLFVWNGKYPYWRSGPWNGQIFIGIPGADTYYQNGFHLVNDDPLSAYLTITYTNVSILSYVALNTSGVLIQKFWADGYRDWAVIWSSIGNECDVYGKCGPFGICDSRATPICSCFQGFEPKSSEEWNAANWTSGCKRKTLLRCEKNSSVEDMGKEDGFLTLKTMKLPDSFNWFSTSEVDCRNQCLNNCSCSGYAFDTGIGCLWWIGSFIDVQKFSSGGTNLYIRLASSELGHKKNLKAIISTVAVLGFVAVSVCTLFLWKRLLMYTGRKHMSGMTNQRYSKESVLEGVRIEELPLFTLETLSSATEQFDSANMLGQGGFGPVYKGKLSNGREIAVKRLVRSSNQGLEEFVTEVEVISKLQHRNLVRILGCCVESEENMLVYEYMPNGSLDGYIFDSHKQAFLDWKQRVVIIEGICRGLLYLHRDSRLRIIHRDLKASNILLDEDLNPKISDFGTARIFGGKEDQAKTTRVIGTFGYMAPEYALRGRFSEKTDVYSFGVLLLEIVSGRKNSSFYHEEQELSLISYAWKLWNEEDMSSFMDPEFHDPRVAKEILRYTQVGLLCVQETAKDRPNISTVLSMLSNEIVELPRPNHPAFTVDQSTGETEPTNRFASKSSSNNITLTVIEGR